jgi:hypothetical protein
MMIRWTWQSAALVLLSGLAACASVVSSTESTVQVRTNPAGAKCALTGHEGYSSAVTTPATVIIPNNASPVTVWCEAEGFRRTSYTMTASSDGWIWANSAFIVSTGGIALLGALVDESRSAGRTFAEEVEYDLEPAKAKSLRLKSRNDGSVVKLKVE